MYIDPSAISCGVKQLFCLDPNDKMLNYTPPAGAITYSTRIVWKNWKATLQRIHLAAAFLVFSDHASIFSNGHAVAAKFRKYGYTVWESDESINPNSGNSIKVWTVKL